MRPFIKWFPERRVTPLNRISGLWKLSDIGGAGLTVPRLPAVPLICSSKMTTMVGATWGEYCLSKQKF